jgi:hypothetical protein
MFLHGFSLISLLQLGGMLIEAGIVCSMICGIVYCVRKEGLKKHEKKFLKIALAFIIVGIIFLAVALAFGGWRAFFVA